MKRERRTNGRKRVDATAADGHVPIEPSEGATKDAWGAEQRETAVIPILTLPSRPSSTSSRQPAIRGTSSPPALTPQRTEPEWDEPDVQLVPLADSARQRVLARPLASAPPAPVPRNRLANLSRRIIPGTVRRAGPRAAALASAAPRAAGVVRRHKALVTAITLVVVVVGILVDATGIARGVGLPNLWLTRSGATVAPTPTPLPAPDIVDASYYVAIYGFDYPRYVLPIPSDEWQRLAFMLPYDLKATAAYDARYGQHITPELVMWWTHAEGIGGNISYSNCANFAPRPGLSYFSDIENCPHSSFWQLGYGNQFSQIYILKNAFTDMHGSPNDPHLVQKVGQWVLDYDRSQGTLPVCGGYSCTFPALTIDQIMSGINETTGVETSDNWWASVLSRDPAINCYMIAQALSFFNHAATINWVGCYYAEPCWGNESDRLGDILAAWSGLRKAAGV
jgi:hypothetical protein